MKNWTKRFWVQVLLGALLGLLAIWATGCRSVKQSRSKADSTVVRSEASAERFTTETVREYAVFDMPKPRLTGKMPANSAWQQWPALQFVTTPGQTLYDTITNTVRETHLIRETVRTTGEKVAAKMEEKAVAVATAATEKEQDELTKWSMVMAAGSMLLFGLAVLAVVVWWLFFRRRA